MWSRIRFYAAKIMRYTLQNMLEKHSIISCARYILCSSKISFLAEALGHKSGRVQASTNALCVFRKHLKNP